MRTTAITFSYSFERRKKKKETKHFSIGESFPIRCLLSSRFSRKNERLKARERCARIVAGKWPEFERKIGWNESVAKGKEEKFLFEIKQSKNNNNNKRL